MTDLATCGLLVGAALLAVAGVAKAARPDDTARALRRAGLPVAPWLVRFASVVEAGLGLVAAIHGGPVLAWAVAASYASFGTFVAVALAKGWPLSTCGCFGRADARPSVGHVAADGALALAAASAVHAPAPLRLMTERPDWGAAAAALSAVICGLLYLVLTALPRLEAR